MLFSALGILVYKQTNLYTNCDLSGIPSSAAPQAGSPLRSDRLLRRTGARLQPRRAGGTELLMIDLHTHTLFSDGVLIPSEHVRRFESMGYSAVAITDHADASLLDFTIPRIVQVAQELNKVQSVKVIPGIELTHIPPDLIDQNVKRSRELGAKLVLIHGETIVEPVAPGTNRAGLEASADMLVHPGLISKEEARLAAEKAVFLEISARAGHSLTNGYVVRLANEVGAKLILSSDGHAPRDFMTEEFANKVVEGAGLPHGSLSALLSNARQLLEKIGYPL